MHFSLNENNTDNCIRVDIKDIKDKKDKKKEKKKKKEKNDSNINLFLDKWKEQYENKQRFSFIIDTSCLTSPSVKDCYKAIKFIRKIKKEKIQYLNYSVIAITSYHVRNLLFYIFKIQTPVAPVFIVKNIELAEQLTNSINRTVIDSELVKCFCDINDVYIISNKVNPENYVIDKTLEAIDTIDDSIEALKALAE